MKLRNQMTMHFSLLVFFVLNVFGVLMIQTVFHQELETEEYRIYEVFTNIEYILENGTAEENLDEAMPELGSWNKEDTDENQNTVSIDKKLSALQHQKILKRRLYAAFGGMAANSRGAVLYDGDGNVVATTLRHTLSVPEDMFLPGEDLEHHIVNGNPQELLVSGEINDQGNRMTLVYSSDISEIFDARRKYLKWLLLFDVVGGTALLLLISFISGKITKPLQRLTEQADAIAALANADTIGSELQDRKASTIEEISRLSSAINTMQEEIEKRITELEEKNEEQERFIGALTHELRTPLTAIIGYASLFEARATDEADKAAFREIHQNGKRLQGLSEALMRLLTISKDSPEYGKIDLRELCEEAAGAYQKRIDEWGVHLTIEGAATVASDHDLLLILVSNLLDNALKAVKEKERKEIIIQVSSQSLSVTDMGKGIPKDDIKKIFEPFFMVDRSRKRTYGGFGLGLAISAKIRDALHLDIKVESDEGKGSRFTIVFPE